jgi:hypothetical protein
VSRGLHALQVVTDGWDPYDFDDKEEECPEAKKRRKHSDR